MTTAAATTPGPEGKELPLRERKRLRTRRALVETALARYARDGFERTTLDDLTDEVEISKRTFFRYFASKEDVALAPEKEFWAEFLKVLEASTEAELTGPVLGTLHRALITALERMGDEWERRFAESRRLVERTPALAAHSLQHCAETAEAILALLSVRLGPLVADDACPPETPETPGMDGLRLRIALEITVAAFRCALHAWSTGPADAGRPELIALTDRAFAAVPGSLDLMARPAGETEQTGQTGKN
ncbi:TetR family transcriptional regulator [Streptomyces sp. NPDC000594]|uniref:TetR family transcriptional regulator n=1 Tax=Streptomyces sp. NPDC000594 TaxID=3154261 RepID=UPI0033257689